jgi:hypothetical protein
MINKRSENMQPAEIEEELIHKDQRAKFWEKYHSVPTNPELAWWVLEAEP